MMIRGSVKILNPGGIYTNCKIAFEYNNKNSNGYKNLNYALSKEDRKYIKNHFDGPFQLLSNVTDSWLMEEDKEDVFENFPWLYGWQYEWSGQKKEQKNVEIVVCLRKMVDGELRRILMALDSIQFEETEININPIWGVNLWK